MRDYSFFFTTKCETMSFKFKVNVLLQVFFLGHIEDCRIDLYILYI